MIAAIRANPAITPQQVSDKIAQTALGDSITYSSRALDARMTTLKTAVDQWAIALKNGLPTYKSAYLSAWRGTLNFTDATEKDLYDAAAQIKAKVSGDFAFYKANEALALQTNWDEFLASFCNQGRPAGGRVPPGRDAAPGFCALLHSQGSWEQCAQDLDPEGKRRQTGALLPPRAVHSSN